MKQGLLSLTKDQPEYIDGAAFVETISMTVDEWISVPDCPVQRNTERRAATASHLLTPNVTHAHVDMAVLPNGARHKLEGHTRAHLWKLGLAPRPRMLKVNVYACQTVKVVEELYDTFNSSLTSKDQRDKIHGAFGRHGFEPTSELFRGERVAVALRLATRFLKDIPAKSAESLKVGECVDLLIDEIKILDAIMPRTKRFTQGVIASALISLARYGKREEVIQFWSRFSENDGRKTSVGMDAVQALEERLQNTNINGAKGRELVVGICLSALSSYLTGFIYKKGQGGGVKALKLDSVTEYGSIAMKAKATREAVRNDMLEFRLAAA